MTRPTWSELRAGITPTSVSASELGEWQHGWQYYASSSLEFHFREPWYLPSLLPLTRLICDRTQAEERARSCA